MIYREVVNVTYIVTPEIKVISFLDSFLNYEPISQLMQGAGVAVLTLLISFAIGIFIHHLDDGRRRKNFLDLHVALDYVWMFKRSVAFLLVVVLSPFLMSVESLFVKSLVFIVWSISLGFLIWIIFRLYGWVKGDKDDYRREYLSDFPKTPRDQIVAWGDLWASDEGTDDRFREKDFFVPFAAEIDRLFKSENKEDWTTLLHLLGGFVDRIKKRNKIFLLVFPEFFPKVLGWHLIIWEKQYSQYAKDKDPDASSSVEHHLFEVGQVVDQMIQFVTHEALVGNTGNAYSYFKTLEEHIKKYEDKSIQGNEHLYLYVEHIPIYSDCLDFIPNSQDSYNIWNHYFPESWKITISNLKTNKISNIWYARFLDWSRSRIWKDENNEDWDKEMEELSRELFPNVDPITWAKIYTFVMRPWSQSRIQQTIEKGVKFGYAGRVISGWGDDFESNFSKIYEAELESTFDLTMYLFGSIFTEDNLDNWIAELETLNYSEESSEFKRKQVWKGIFSALRKRIESKRD